MNYLIEDLSKLTTIPKLTLKKLAEHSENCIAHQVFETKLNLETITAIDIGLGTLYIKWDSDDVEYKFIPSTNLNNKVINAITTDSSTLITTVEDTLKQKILNTYKDLF